MVVPHLEKNLCTTVNLSGLWQLIHYFDLKVKFVGLLPQIPHRVFFEKNYLELFVNY